MSLVRNNSLGIYISVPFCRSKCTYCNFASGVYSAGEHGRYVDRLIEDFGRRGVGGADGRGIAADGGYRVPGRRNADAAGAGADPRLFGVLHTVFDVDTGAEITVECAPGQIPDTTLDALAGAA